MLFFGILSIFLLTASAEYCYNDIESACSTNPKNGGLITNCHAQYGGTTDLQPDLQAYANANIETSFEFLLMSTHFGNYETNREGFKGLFRKLSDKSWEDSINLIKYITKRGGRMDLNQLSRFKKPAKDSKILELTELNSLAKALDSEKALAVNALDLHSQTQHSTKYDVDIAHYLEDHLESLSERVRDLAGHSNDLKNLLEDRDPSVSVFLFDEYLKKTL